MPDESGSGAAPVTSATSTQKKRPSCTTPPSLMPASKAARLQQEQEHVLADADTTEEMDEEIAKHFLGESTL